MYFKRIIKRIGSFDRKSGYLKFMVLESYAVFVGRQMHNFDEYDILSIDDQIQSIYRIFKISF